MIEIPLFSLPDAGQATDGAAELVVAYGLCSSPGYRPRLKAA
jgi:hypothetical protein